MRRWSMLAVVLAGCGFSLPSGSAPGDGPHADAPADALDAPPDMAVPLGTWGNVTLLSDISSTSAEDDPTLTGDMLEVYFDRSGDIYGSTRSSAGDPWPNPVPIATINSAASTETTCEVSADGLELFFSSNRTTSAGGQDIWVATRANRGLPFGAPTRVMELDGSGEDVTPTTVGNAALVMYLTSTRSNGSLDIFRTTRANRSAPWASPALVMELQTAGIETEPTVNAAETYMILSGDGPGGRDLYVTQRTSVNAPWDTPAPITELNTPFSEEDPWMSPDGRTLVFASTRGGSYELYMATR